MLLSLASIRKKTTIVTAILQLEKGLGSVFRITLPVGEEVNNSGSTWWLKSLVRTKAHVRKIIACCSRFIDHHGSAPFVRP